LVIDDSATVRAIVEQVVEAEPDSRVVGVAATVEAARHLLDDLKPNLISLDLNMPGIGGLAFLEELSGLQHAPIIVLSSSTTAGSEARKQALSRGAEACFDKNLILADAERFRRLLHKILVRRQRQK
jgi:two-component system chemotaxis response regulator CheB